MPNTQYNTYYCICPSSYTGTTCEYYNPPTTTAAPVSNVCQPSPCLNGGVCVVQQYNTFVCICPSNYQGSTCQQLIHTTQNSCTPNPCMNGGFYS